MFNLVHIEIPEAMAPERSVPRFFLLDCSEARESGLDELKGCKGGNDGAGVWACFHLLLWGLTGIVPLASPASSKDCLTKCKAEATERARCGFAHVGIVGDLKVVHTVPSPCFPKHAIHRNRCILPDTKWPQK